MIPPEHILVVGVNWIGDTIMAMPAVQRFKFKHPHTRLTFLVKPAVADLWRFHDAADDVWIVQSGSAGTREAIARIRTAAFQRAYILPNSFRSAWIPWRAGIPERHGMPGHWRRCFLNHIIRPALTSSRAHQVFEYLDVFLPEENATNWELPQLHVPDEWRDRARARIQSMARPVVAFLPGAARGPSKQWPTHHFVALGKRLSAHSDASILVLGSSNERALCNDMASAIGKRAVSCAGETSIAEWIALLGECDLVVANDSGGMHVAAALDRPVVALYGLTDPAVTGPLGRRITILQKPGPRQRDIPRISPEAEAALSAITPEEAFEASKQWLKENE